MYDLYYYLMSFMNSLIRTACLRLMNNTAVMAEQMILRPRHSTTRKLREGGSGC
jgi:hypothetical protein